MALIFNSTGQNKFAYPVRVVNPEYIDTTVPEGEGATADDIVDGKIAFVNGEKVVGTSSGGGGGGGIGTLIAEQALGKLGTTAGTIDTGKTVTVSGIDSYDLLIVEISQPEVADNRHMATARVAMLTAPNGGEKTSAVLVNYLFNCRRMSDYYVTQRSTQTYGIYPNSVTLSDGVVTFPIYMRYSIDYTSNIDGYYTARVYGVNLIDLIGG